MEFADDRNLWNALNSVLKKTCFSSGKYSLRELKGSGVKVNHQQPLCVVENKAYFAVFSFFQSSKNTIALISADFGNVFYIFKEYSSVSQTKRHDPLVG